jgi:hypothetical protein
MIRPAALPLFTGGICLLLGCSAKPAPVEADESAETRSSTEQRSAKTSVATSVPAKHRGFERVLAGLPADMRENLSHNELRRQRANEWLAKNIVGQAVELPVTADEIKVDKAASGRYWVRIWLQSAPLKLLGEDWVPSIGPGCEREDIVFGSSLSNFSQQLEASMVFGEQKPWPSKAFLELTDAAQAEQMADLRGKSVTLRGKVVEFAFHQAKNVFGADMPGGLLVRLKDASVNGIPVLAKGPAEVELLAAAPQNPYGVQNEPIPDGPLADQLLAKANLTGDDKDPNAEAWMSPDLGPFEALDGAWSSRWRSSTKPDWRLGTSTEITRKEDLLYIRFIDSDGTYLLVVKDRGGGMYAGHSINVAYPLSISPFAARVVSPDRIDGVWIDSAGKVSRWDFRR